VTDANPKDGFERMGSIATLVIVDDSDLPGGSIRDPTQSL
jgi:hypothetical protein